MCVCVCVCVYIYISLTEYNLEMSFYHMKRSFNAAVSMLSSLSHLPWIFNSGPGQVGLKDLSKLGIKWPTWRRIYKKLWQIPQGRDRGREISTFLVIFDRDLLVQKGFLQIW